MKKKKTRRQILRERQMTAMLILGILLIVTVIGVVIGTKIGAGRRSEIAAKEQEAIEAQAEEEAARRREEEARQSAAEEASRAEAEDQARQQDHTETQQLLAEQTKAANKEKAEQLKLLAAAGIADVSAYAVSQVAPPQEVTPSHVVCIDAGHERVDLLEKEPNAPGSDVMKQKVSSGTYGNASGLEEYELNLMVALKLQAVLESRGYQVIVTRTDHEVQLSNIDRAEIANMSGAEIMVRIHANSVDDTAVTGALTFGPGNDNAYLSAELIAESIRLGTDIINAFCTATGANNRGYCADNTLTGVNWTQIPCTYIEMGFMSNPDEDLLMADDGYQNRMAEGIANGIDAFFAGN